MSNGIQRGTDGYVEAGESKSFVITVERTKLLHNIDNWGRFVFLPDLRLLKEIDSILEGKIKIGKHKTQIPITKFNDIMISIGVDRHRFIDTFRVVDKEIPGTVKVLWGGEEAQRLRMMSSPNAFALPRIDSGKAIFEEIAGTLLIPDRTRVNTAHVISMVSTEKVISNMFYAVKLKNETPEKLKALCIWLNTTWGLLSILASRHDTHGAFIELTQSHWRLLPILDVNNLSEDELNKLAKLFEQFKNSRLARIPIQYGSTGKIDKIRFDLDRKFLNIFGLTVEENELLPLYTEINQSLTQWIGN